MLQGINPNSVLILYEGDTEREFYKKIIDKYISKRTIKINYGNLNGNFNLNDKVSSKIQSYLLNEASIGLNCIHVFVAYDREGDIQTPSLLDINYLKKEFIFKKSRVNSINEIIATQDLESWFFHDLEGIYSYLKVPKSKRTFNNYKNTEYTNNLKLSSLFYRFNKQYQKGKRVEGFIDSLDLDKIYSNCKDLQNAIDLMKRLSQ